MCLNVKVTQYISHISLIVRIFFKKISFSVLAIHSPNTPEYAIIYLGAASAGVTVTTINPIYTVCKLFFFFVFLPKFRGTFEPDNSICLEYAEGK